MRVRAVRVLELSLTGHELGKILFTALVTHSRLVRRAAEYDSLGASRTKFTLLEFFLGDFFLLS